MGGLLIITIGDEMPGNSITGGPRVIQYDARTLETRSISKLTADATKQLEKVNKAKERPLEDKKNEFQDKIKSLDLLKVLTKNLGESASNLRTNISAAQKGVFGQLNASLISNGTTAGTDIIDCNITSSLKLKQFTVCVNRLPSYDTSVAITAVADPTVELALNGNLNINGTNIPITVGMALNDVNNTVNGLSNTTGVSSTILNLGGQYFLSLNATALATKFNIVQTSLSGVIPVNSAFAAQDLQAQFQFNNTTLYSPSNIITNLDNSGALTLTLKKVDLAVVTVNVSLDPAIVKNAILDLVKKYNDLNDFITFQKGKDKNIVFEGYNPVLANTPLLNEVRDEIRDLVSSQMNLSPGSLYKSLADIGISFGSFQQNPNLSIIIDNSALDTAISSNIGQIVNLFDFIYTNSDPNFIITAHPGYIPPNVILNTSLALNLSKDVNGVLSATIVATGGAYNGMTFTIPTTTINSIGDTVNNFTVTGNNIYINTTNVTSPSTPDLPFVGFTFAYLNNPGFANGTTLSANYTISQGLGDRLTNVIDKKLTPYTGSFYRTSHTFAREIDKTDEKIKKMQHEARKAIDKQERVLEKVASINMRFEGEIRRIDAMLGIHRK